MADVKISGKSDVSPAVGTMMIPVELAAGSAGRLPLSSLFVPLGVENTVTAFAGGGQGSATALTATTKFHRVSTCATAGDSVKFPTSVANDWHLLINDGATSCQMFGAGTDTIDGVATATGVALPAGHRALLSCTAAGNWNSMIAPSNALYALFALTTGATFTGAVTGSTFKSSAGIPHTASSVSAMTAVAGHAGMQIDHSHSAAVALVIPAATAVAFTTGAVIFNQQVSAGRITYTGASGVTLVNVNSQYKSQAVNSVTFCQKVDTDRWNIVGATGA